MTQLVKFPVDQDFKARLQRTGFDLDDPDCRYPTHNDFADRLLGLRKMSRGGKAAQLLSDRTGPAAPERQRLLAWLAPGLGAIGWPEPAVADMHEPTYLPAIDAAPSPTALRGGDLEALLTGIDLSNPIWALALGGALLMTQTIALFQRRALLKTTKAMIAPSQLELFDEIEDTFPTEPAPPALSPWQVDAETRQGQVRSENQDALSVVQFDDGSAVLIVCDGAGGVGGGREASQSAVKAIEAALRAAKVSAQPLEITDLEAAIAVARQASVDEKQPGVTTALIVSLSGRELRYATLGDGAVTVVWPDGMVSQVQVPHHTLGKPRNEIGAYIGGGCNVPARTGCLRLEPGCFVLAMSDGASDLLDPMDIARHRAELTDITGLAETFLAHLEAAKDEETGGWLHSDNMTLAMARLGEVL